MSRLLKQIAIAGLALTVAASNANANFLDSFFGGLFGPGGQPASPRYHVKIHGAFNPGDIVVSFGDRRLYYIDSEIECYQLCHRNPQGRGQVVWRELRQPEAREPRLDPDAGYAP